MRAIFLVTDGNYPNLSQHHTAAGYASDEQMLSDIDLLVETIVRKKEKPKVRDKTQIKREIDILLDELNK